MTTVASRTDVGANRAVRGRPRWWRALTHPAVRVGLGVVVLVAGSSLLPDPWRALLLPLAFLVPGDAFVLTLFEHDPAIDLPGQIALRAVLGVALAIIAALVLATFGIAVTHASLVAAVVVGIGILALVGIWPHATRIDLTERGPDAPPVVDPLDLTIGAGGRTGGRTGVRSTIVLYVVAIVVGVAVLLGVHAMTPAARDAPFTELGMSGVPVVVDGTTGATRLPVTVVNGTAAARSFDLTVRVDAEAPSAPLRVDVRAHGSWSGAVQAVIPAGVCSRVGIVLQSVDGAPARSLSIPRGPC